MKTAINTTLEIEIKQLALDNNINFNKSLNFGIIFELAERGLADYPECKLLEKMEKLRLIMEEKSEELEELRESLK